MTTTPSPIPSHIEDAMEAASRAGWEVTRRTKGVRFVPHPGHRGIDFSLTKPPTPDQVRVKLEKAGLGSVLRELITENSSAPPGQRSGAEKKSEKLVCPECKADHFARPASLGSHRQRSHGVVGTSKASKERHVASVKGRRVASAKKAGPAPSLKRKPAPPQRSVLADLAAASPVADVRTSSPEVAKAIETLIHAVAKEGQDHLFPLQEKIEQQGKQIAELQDFKDKVEAEVANVAQAPIQTLANIMKHGGEGFGTPKA